MANIKFTTLSGSVYELDRENKCIRRLTGIANPTPRQGKNGEYRTYLYIHPELPELNESLLITWYIEDGIHKCTETSPIISME